MESEQTTNTNPQKSSPKRRTFFIIGILLGLLLGAMVTILIVNWLHYKHPTVVKVYNPKESGTSNDTVVKYVIHKHESVGSDYGMYDMPDSLAVDSAYLEDESEDLLLDAEDLLDMDAEEDDVQADRLLGKQTVKVTFLDNNKEEGPVSEKGISHLHIQLWNTPIKNRLTYLFENDVVKVKGLPASSSIRVVHYKNIYYLVTNQRVYPIHHNSQYERLTADPNVEL